MHTSVRRPECIAYIACNIASACLSYRSLNKYTVKKVYKSLFKLLQI